MNLAIIGSQEKSFLRAAQYRVAGNLVCMIFQWYDPSQIELFLSGGCDGIDKMAEAQADHLGIQKRIHLPSEKNWEAYKIRNRRIAEECDVLYSVRSQYSKTYGSGWTADYAESLGKEVFRYVV
jgi:hypothetical protein